MTTKSTTISSYILNIIYFILVFAVALFFTTLGLARRLNSYDANRQDLFLKVEKKEVDISNSISAQVKEIFVEEGQGVKKGDTLLTLEDGVSAAKIKTLDRVAVDNVSARTESAVLKAQTGYYTIKSPDTGVIYAISVTNGTYLTNSAPVMRLFSDTEVKLTGLFSTAEYLELSKQKKLDVYSSRLEQIFEVEFFGISKVVEGSDKQAKYELFFNFVRPEDAATFIQGEQLSVVAKSRDPITNRPEEVIKRFWNSFILGPNSDQVSKN